MHDSSRHGGNAPKENGAQCGEKIGVYPSGQADILDGSSFFISQFQQVAGFFLAPVRISGANAPIFNTGLFSPTIFKLG